MRAFLLLVVLPGVACGLTGCALLSAADALSVPTVPAFILAIPAGILAGLSVLDLL
jgi:hypothetical protein